MNGYTRRRFLQSLRLGAGAAFLSPIVEGLVSPAQGADASSQRLIIMIAGRGFPGAGGDDDAYTPKPFRRGSVPPNATVFPWPRIFAPLEGYRSSSVFLEGMGDQFHLGHGSGHALLSCVMPSGGDLSNGFVGPVPNAITFDEMLARSPLGADRTVPAVRFGTQEKDSLTLERATYFSARGRNDAIFHAVQPSVLAGDLFGKTPAGQGGSNAASVRRGLLLGSARQDIARIKTRLASEERARLDVYLQFLDDYDKRLAAAKQLKCDAAPSAYYVGSDQLKRLEGMADMTALALRCGMSRIAVIGGLTTYDHNGDANYPGLRNKIFGWSPGSSPSNAFAHDHKYAQYMGYLHGEHSRVLAGILDKLSDVPGRFPSNTTVVFISDRFLTNSDDGALTSDGIPLPIHHGNTLGYGILVMSSNPALRTGGRYLRFPQKTRRLASLWCTLGHALGMPIDNIGNGHDNVLAAGPWPDASGPMPELLA